MSDEAEIEQLPASSFTPVETYCLDRREAERGLQLMEELLSLYRAQLAARQRALRPALGSGVSRCGGIAGREANLVRDGAGSAVDCGSGASRRS